MRIGLVSDIHANWPALQAVLRALDRRGSDQILVAGDLIGYGGQPNECVTALREAGAQCVAGNHDLHLLGRLPNSRFPPLARLSLDVSRRLLSPEVCNYLASLPTRLQVDDVLVTHGSLDSPEEYVRDETRALELLARLPTEAPGAKTLVLGHTHTQWCVVAARGARRARGTVQLGSSRCLINPGSVGQSRQRERRPRARFAIQDTGTQQVEFHAVDYDVNASLETLRRLGLPDRCLHARPNLGDRATRASTGWCNVLRCNPCTCPPPQHGPHCTTRSPNRYACCPRSHRPASTRCRGGGQRRSIAACRLANGGADRRHQVVGLHRAGGHTSAKLAELFGVGPQHGLPRGGARRARPGGCRSGRAAGKAVAEPRTSIAATHTVTGDRAPSCVPRMPARSPPARLKLRNRMIETGWVGQIRARSGF